MRNITADLRRALRAHYNTDRWTQLPDNVRHAVRQAMQQDPAATADMVRRGELPRDVADAIVAAHLILPGIGAIHYHRLGETSGRAVAARIARTARFRAAERHALDTDSTCVLELPSDLGAIEQTVRHLIERTAEAGFQSDRLHLKLRVGITEALANAVLYGNAQDPSKRVLVEARISPRVLVIRVTDEGVGFDPSRLPDPTTPANLTREGGRGIFLIRQLMDEVDFNERGNSITMVLYGSKDREPAHER